MNYNLTITPKTGDHKDFKYILSITNTSQTSLGSRSTHYGQLAEVELVLTRAGWPELAAKAVSELELGHQFSNMIEISDPQAAMLLQRK
jgi:hypothetical protein